MTEPQVVHATISCSIVPPPDFERILKRDLGFALDKDLKGLVSKRDDPKATMLLLESGRMIAAGEAHPEALWALAEATAYLISSSALVHQAVGYEIEEIVVRAEMGDIDLSAVADALGISPPDMVAPHPRIDLVIEPPTMNVAIYATGTLLLRGRCGVSTAFETLSWLIEGLGVSA
ncbi:MAG: hypothetical protein AB1665_06900 [Candidatus Thermoplasmatota archaeon]